MPSGDRLARYLPAVYIVALLWVNVYICRELFKVEFTRHWGSNEGTLMAIARAWLEHPRDMLWWPFWNAGMPFQNTYLPLLPAATAVYAAFAHCSPAVAFHAVSALAYCLGPVTLFVLAWKMFDAPGYAFAAAMAYSLVSPSALFYKIRIDMDDVWSARRLISVARYGESPHILSLTLLPIAVLFLYWALAGRRGFAIPAGVLAATVVLTNAFGGITLAIAAGCLLLALEPEGTWRRVRRLLAIGVLSYAWVSPLLPPSLLAVIARNSPTVDGDFRGTAGSRVAAVALLGCLVLARSGMLRWKWPFAVRFSALFTMALGAIAGLSLVFGVSLVPQPYRYHIEMEMAVCLLGAAAFRWLATALQWGTRTQGAICVLLLALAARQVVHYRQFAKRTLQPGDVSERIEYRTAKWIDQNLPGDRVMVSGSDGLWFSLFSNNPQLSSGHDPSTPSVMQRIAVYTIYSGQNAGAADGAISTQWLKTFGAQAIVVPGPKSQEMYHPIADPRKFEGLLPVLWREGDDTIYGVPQRSRALAHVVPAGALVRRIPIHGLDVEPLREYLAALDDPNLPVAELQWENYHSGVIRVRLSPDQLISLQMTYAPGWHAAVGGAERPVWADKLGFIVVEPRCNGPCEIQVQYNGGLELHLTMAASGLVMFGVAIGWARRRGQTRLTPD